MSSSSSREGTGKLGAQIQSLPALLYGDGQIRMVFTKQKGGDGCLAPGQSEDPNWHSQAKSPVPGLEWIWAHVHTLRSPLYHPLLWEALPQINALCIPQDKLAASCRNLRLLCTLGPSWIQRAAFLSWANRTNPCPHPRGWEWASWLLDLNTQKPLCNHNTLLGVAMLGVIHTEAHLPHMTAASKFFYPSPPPPKLVPDSAKETWGFPREGRLIVEHCFKLLCWNNFYIL